MLKHSFSIPIVPTRVVVIGANGFIGSAIASRLEQGHVDVVRITRHDVDLLSSDATKKLAGFLKDGDSVVAVSALAPAKTSLMLRDNVTLSIALITALKTIKLCHVVNISSDAVFSDGPLPLTEASPKSPDSYHGLMHLVRETMFQKELSVPLAIVRPT